MKNKHTFYWIAFLLIFAASKAQTRNPIFNENLAKELQADAYGMKMYTLVLLSTGTNQDTTEARNHAFKSHMKNIDALVETGKLILAGPVGKNDAALRGIFILNTTDVGEAKSFLAGDDAIQQAYLSAQYIPYYGSAALATYLPTHDQIWKEKP